MLMRRRAALSVVVVLLIDLCVSCATEGVLPPVAIDLKAFGGYPPSNFGLRLYADNRVELDLDTSWSCPGQALDRAGLFRATLSPSERSEIQAMISKHRLLGRAGSAAGTALVDSVVRSIVLKAGPHTVKLVSDDRDEGIRNLEGKLLALLPKLLKHPARVARGVVEFSLQEGKPQATLVLTNVGTEAFPVLFVDPSSANAWAQIGVRVDERIPLPSGGSMSNPRGESTLSRDRLDAMSKRGLLPRGVHILSPNAALRIPLGALSLPPTKNPLVAIGRCDFYRLGPGPARGLLRIQSRPVSVPAPARETAGGRR